MKIEKMVMKFALFVGSHFFSSYSYICTTIFCKFFLHQQCALNLPQFLSHPTHCATKANGHVLHLRKSSSSSSNLNYICFYCGIEIHPLSAGVGGVKIEIKIKHRSHPSHPLAERSCVSAMGVGENRRASSSHAKHVISGSIEIVRYFPTSSPYSTNPTLSSSPTLCLLTKSWTAAAHVSSIIKYHRLHPLYYYVIHMSCAMLPKRLNFREYHRLHPLYLIFNPAADDDDGLFCEVCEKGVEWLYRCVECDEWYHINCIPSVGYLSKVKFGGTLSLPSSHAHPLTLERMLTVPSQRCGDCKKIIHGMMDEMAFFCSLCHFWLHFSCAAAPHTSAHLLLYSDVRRRHDRAYAKFLRSLRMGREF